MKKVFLLFLFTLAFNQNLQAQICTVIKTSVCNDGECQSKSTVKSWTEINKDHLLRCDSKGCEKYPISVTKSGLFTNVQIPNTSYILKYDQSLNFIEATSFALTLIVNTGKCSN